MTAIPRKIFGYWHQGKAAAPEHIKMCWDLWARMNPDWELRILDWDDMSDAFASMTVVIDEMPYAFVSDIARMTMLSREGGVWVDAYTVPLAPLSHWVPALTPTGFFTHHDPHRKRLSENWFIATAPEHPLATAWHETLVRYWQSPRRPMRSQRELDPGTKGDVARMRGRLADRIKGPPPAKASKHVFEPKKPAWSVAPEGGGRFPIYPYHAFAYCFDLMLEERPELWDDWTSVPKHTSYDCLLLRHWKKHYDRLTPEAIDQICAGKVMQKLALPTPLPDALWAHLLARAEQTIAAAP